jgi:YHS domain-containing protein
MKIMCNFCGKVIDLMGSTSLASEEGGQLKSYNFCSDEHMREFARKKGMSIGKD